MNAAARTTRVPVERPSFLARVTARLRDLVTPTDPILRGTINDEIQFHILERADRLMAQGMSEEAALEEARERFGHVATTRRELEQIGHGGDGSRPGKEFFGSVARDIKQGFRTLRMSPGFAVAVIVTIGLGVGANAAVFSVTDAVLLRALPYSAPEELVSVEAYFPETDRALDRMPIAEAIAWQEAIAGDTDMVVYSRRNFVRTGVDNPESLVAFAVSPNWAEVLGISPARGRLFTAEEATAGSVGTIVLGHSLWRDSFGADEGIVGTQVQFDHREYTVVGVMPRGFKFPVIGAADAWVPLLEDGTLDGVNSVQVGSLLVRLPTGMDVPSLQERLDTLSAGLNAVEPKPNGWDVSAREFDNFRANADVERALWILTGAVGVMLLIAVTNAANLLLVRATSKRSETAVRLALGASRWRLVRQQLTENMILVCGGGVLAVVLARTVLRSIVGLLPGEVTFFLTTEIAVNGRVLGFALFATLCVGLLLSVVPALSSRTDSAVGARSSSSRSTAWLRNGLVVAEVAMTVALLVGATLMANSFLRLTAVDPGYNPAGLMQMSLSLPTDRYQDSPSRRDFFDRVRDGIDAIPGVVAVSLADGVPPGAGFTFGVTPQAEGQEPKELPELFIPNATVDATFFEVLETPIVAGRGFGPADTPESGNVIIDRDMARFFWGDENPVGRRFRLDDEEEPWLTVVGMVDDLKLMGQDDRQGRLELFRPLPTGRARGFMSIILRSGLPPETIAPQLRALVRELDPDLPIYRLTSGDAALAAENDKPRFFLMMMGIFAGIALGLAIIGTYGVLAFTVRQRHRELGVRIALGARNLQIKGMVLTHGVGLAAAGIAIGLAGAWVLRGVTGSLLFEVEPTDPLTFTIVSAVMLGCAALACWVPARRATRVDPVEVLRAE